MKNFQMSIIPTRLHPFSPRTFLPVCLIGLLLCSIPRASAEVGDPQLRTDHPWYPGELSCSTFERLFSTQAALFEREVGRPVQTDEDRVLAAWMWRNLNYAHGEEGRQNLWGKGFDGGDTTTREYWTGLYAHGFGLCGTTHAQWTAELNALLGHGRSRTVGVVGHNSCEVFLKGGAYGVGQWALLDHDVSTVIFDPSGKRLLSIDEVRQNLKQLIDPKFQPQRQHGWPLGGLHPDDPQSYSQFNVAESLPGYSGPPPLVSLRRGETLRRYFQPGLEDGKTFVFWGRNYRTGDIPGPERSRTWVNQPERFLNSPQGAGYRQGQARYGNAVYTYRPNFRDGSYKEGVILEDAQQVVFEFQTPYMIGATPADTSDWGVYVPGGRKGLVVHGAHKLTTQVSVDNGASWQTGVESSGTLDLTDVVKGSRQYWLKFAAPATRLIDSEIEIVTVCQANPALFPRLAENGSTVTFAASNQSVVSAGPTIQQATQHVVAGAFDSPRVTLELVAPRNQQSTTLYAAAHVASSSPPDPAIRYQIEYSADQGQSWLPVVKDWNIARLGKEPADFWSQSFCYGKVTLPGMSTQPIQVRFRNDGGKRYLRAEAHLVYNVPSKDRCQVTFAWSDSTGANHRASQTFANSHSEPWHVETGANVQMKWVELTAVP